MSQVEKPITVSELPGSPQQEFRQLHPSGHQRYRQSLPVRKFSSENDKEDQHSVRKHLDAFRSHLLGARPPLDDQSNGVHKQTSQQPSHFVREYTSKLVTALIDFVSKTKLHSSEAEMALGAMFKQAANMDDLDLDKKGQKLPNYFHLLELVINRNFDRDFDPMSSIDWDRFFRFRNRIDLKTIEIEDPLVRTRIRQNNLQFAIETYGKGILSKIDDIYPRIHKSPKLFLTLLELGLISGAQIAAKRVIPGFIEELKKEIQTLSESIASVTFEDTHTRQSPTKRGSPTKPTSPLPHSKNRSQLLSMMDPNKEQATDRLTADIREEEQRQLNLAKLEVQASEIIASSPCIQQLVILSHLVVLLNDEIFAHNWNTDASAKGDMKPAAWNNKNKTGRLKYVFEGDNPHTGEPHNDCILAILECIKEIPKEYYLLKDPHINHTVNRLLLNILHIDKDFYTASMKLLKGSHSEALHTLLQNQEHQKLSAVWTEDIQDVVTQVIENYYQSDKDGSISSSLTAKLISLFKQLRTHADSPGFRVNFGVNGGATSILVLLHLLSRNWETDSSVRWIVSHGLCLLSALCKDNHVVGTQLFKERSWEIVEILSAFDPTYVGVLLTSVANNCILQLQNSNELVERVKQLFKRTFTEAKVKLKQFDTDRQTFWQSYVGQKDLRDKDRNLELHQNLVGMIMLSNTLTTVIQKSKDNHFKKTVQLTLQEELYEFLVQESIPFLLNQNNWEVMSKLNSQNPDRILEKSLPPLLVKCQDSNFNEFFNDWRYRGHEEFPEFWDRSRGQVEPISDSRTDGPGSEWQQHKAEQTQLVFQSHYFLLSLFNKCVTGIELQHVKDGILNLFRTPKPSHSRQTTIIRTDIFKHLGVFDYGMYYLEVLTQVYTNCILLEIQPVYLDETATKLTQQTTTQSTEQKGKKKDTTSAEHLKSLEVQIYNMHAQEILEMILQLADQSTNRFKKDHESMNKRFMFRGLLRMMIKFLRGLIFEKDKLDLGLIHINNLLYCVLDRKDFFFDMCGTPEESRRRFNSERSRFILGSRDSSSSSLRNTNSTDKYEQKTNFENATNLAKTLAQLYDDDKLFNDEISLYDRETAEELQDGPTKIFDEISDMGSACLMEMTRIMRDNHKSLLERKEAIKEKQKRDQPPQPQTHPAKPEVKKTEFIEEKAVPVGTVNSKITKIPNTRATGDKTERVSVAPPIHGPFSRPHRLNSRPSTSQTNGQNGQNQDVGDSKHELLQGVRQETFPDLNKSLNQSLQDNTKKREKQLYPEELVETVPILDKQAPPLPPKLETWDAIMREVDQFVKAKEHSIFEGYGQDDPKKKPSQRSHILKAIEETNSDVNQVYVKAVIGWIMYFFDLQKHELEGGTPGLLFIRNPTIVQLVTIFGNLLTLRPKYRDIYFDMYFSEEIKPSHRNTTDEENYIHEVGKQFIKVLLESAIAIQKQIKDSVFTTDIYIICENYFLICLTLKGMVEGNLLEMKKMIGNDIFPKEKDKEKRRPLKEMFDGLALDPNSENSRMSRLSTTDRADLSWYNIVTLWTLTEFLSGPCPENQFDTIEDYGPIFTMLSKINMNPMSIMYKVQTEMATFLSAALEENTTTTTLTLSKQIPPERIYMIMCRHIQNLFDLATRSNGDIVMDRLMSLYKADEGFNTHPSINIAIRMYFIMKSIASLGIVKKYANFVLSKETERMDTRMESSILKNFIGSNVVGLFQNEKLDLFLDGAERTLPDINGGSKASLGSVSVEIKSIRSKEKKTANELGSDRIKPVVEQDPSASNQLRIYDFVSEITASVEILFQNPNMPAPSKQQVYFPRQPETFLITQENMSEFMNTCSFKDSNSKVLDLMNFVSAYWIEMSNNKQIYQKYPKLGNFAREDAFNYYKLVLWVLGLAMNILALLSLEFTPDPVYDNKGIELAIAVIELVIIGLAAFGLLLWVLFKYPENVQIQKSHTASNKYINDRNSLLQMYDVYLGMSLLNQLAPLSYLIHISAVVFRMLFSPWFFSLHLINIVCISHTTRYVIKSITKHYYQLIATLILTFIAIYSFSVVVGSQYGRTFPQYGTENDTNECASMASCLLYVTDLGLRNGGGIGDALNPVPQDDPSFIGNILLHLGFFILINLVALNIVFGIILDTFAELRDNQQARENDAENICFICGYDRKTFEKQEKKFTTHTSEEHNKWYYVYYLIYLLGKNASDYTGIEYYVMEKYKSRNTDWFPIQNTRYIEANDEKGIKKIQDQLSKFSKDLEEVNKQLVDFKDNWENNPSISLQAGTHNHTEFNIGGERSGFEIYSDRKWTEKVQTVVRELEEELSHKMTTFLSKAEIGAKKQTEDLNEVLAGVDRLRLFKKQ